jgi:hypothetical protein
MFDRIHSLPIAAYLDHGFPSPCQFHPRTSSRNLRNRSRWLQASQGCLHPHPRRIRALLQHLPAHKFNSAQLSRALDHRSIWQRRTFLRIWQASDRYVRQYGESDHSSGTRCVLRDSGSYCLGKSHDASQQLQRLTSRSVRTMGTQL